MSVLFEWGWHFSSVTNINVVHFSFQLDDAGCDMYKKLVSIAVEASQQGKLKFIVLFNFI